MIPTGTPASTNHPAAPSGELNSIGKPIDPKRLKTFPFMPSGLSIPVSKLRLAIHDPRTLTLPPADHHVEHIEHQGRRDREEDPRDGDGPASHFILSSGQWAVGSGQSAVGSR